MKVAELPTPALVIDRSVFDANLARMREALPGPRLRPHVKAHKCTALAREQAALGHTNFTCATPSEVVGMARAGLGDDLLLANECVDAHRLRAMASSGARVTVAVDSPRTVVAASSNGIKEVLIDVNVGMPRCGCAPDAAGSLADAARAAGLTVRGVMGYEGHAVLIESRETRARSVTDAMTLLARAHEAVGGDVVSAGGTGTYDLNEIATEIQAGSYALMDSAYDKLGLPFRRTLAIVATVVHVGDEWAVADCGLKALGMDHGDPAMDDARVWFCSDEHITFSPPRVRVGDRVFVWPAHIDPTIALHERIHVASSIANDAEVLDTWPVDLRGWDVPSP